MNQHRRRSKSLLAIILSAGIVIILVVFFVSILNHYTHNNVQVSGTIVTHGLGPSPIGIDFTSPSGQVYSAQVIEGQYSLSLPDGEDYTSIVSWVNISLGTSGTCNGGTLDLNVNSASYTWNTSC